MAHDEMIADLQARLERLEQENRQLTEQLSRRGLFKKVGAAAAGATGVAAIGATPAAADNGQPVLVGKSNSGTEPTEISAPVSARGALYVFNTSGSGNRFGRAIGAVGREIGITGYGENRAGSSAASRPWPQPCSPTSTEPGSAASAAKTPPG